MTRAILLVLLVIGTVLPLAIIAPWLFDHGLDVSAFVADLFASPASAFFAVDVIVSAVVVAFLALTDATLSTRRRSLVLAATFLVGVSCGLPLWALLREHAA